MAVSGSPYFKKVCDGDNMSTVTSLIDGSLVFFLLFYLVTAGGALTFKCRCRCRIGAGAGAGAGAG